MIKCSRFVRSLIRLFISSVSLCFSMDAFQSRSNALEGMYFRGHQQSSMETYVKRLVDEGKLPPAALNTLVQDKAEIRHRPANEFVYRHVKHQRPGTLRFTRFLESEFLEFSLPESVSMGLGQSVRLGGLSRWTVDGISIFDVQTGKKLAATPRRQPSVFEVKRAAAIEKAATETPLVGRYRLYPRLSPGRAFFWGTMVALTGTMIGTKVACLVLDINGVDEVAHRMKSALSPFKTLMESTFTPVNGALVTAGDGSVDATSLNKFASQLKEKFSYSRH